MISNEEIVDKFRENGIGIDTLEKSGKMADIRLTIPIRGRDKPKKTQAAIQKIADIVLEWKGVVAMLNQVNKYSRDSQIFVVLGLSTEGKKEIFRYWVPSWKRQGIYDDSIYVFDYTLDIPRDVSDTLTKL